MADKKPLLIFPKPAVADREPRPSGRSNLNFPDHERQKQRIGRRWQTLKDSFDREALSLSLNPEGFFTEYIVVFELAGSIEEFYTAISKIPGMFFLKELLEEFESDEDFYKDDLQQYSGRVYISMVNQNSIKELLRLWKIYKRDREASFDSGLTKFRSLFTQLRDVRPYSVEDRFRDTGMFHYLEEVRGLGKERVRFEIEFAYPEGQIRRDRAYEEVQSLINEAGGEIISGSKLDLRSIRYLACLADAPISVFENLTSSTQVRFLKASHVLFFRPPGQAMISQGSNESLALDLTDVTQVSETFGDPMVAVFDGLPLENHDLLRGRVKVDDPDGFTSKYIAGSRIHGTAVISTVCHGDLNGKRESLIRPIYARPVMHYNGISDREEFPEDRLIIDIMHRAIIRMVRGTQEVESVANRVKVVNISLGDGYRPYRKELSTWAMFLDWAAFEYNLLFIVSAGNFVDDIKFTIDPLDFRNPISNNAKRSFLGEIMGQDFNRKILSPAESINSLTIGALDKDESIIDLTESNFTQRIKLTSDHGYLAPYSRFGWGHNGSIKPDILMPGGKALLRRKPADRGPDHVNLSFEQGGFPNPPGILVASPGSEGQSNQYKYYFGTTFSAAMTTHLAAKLIEVLLELNQGAPSHQQIEEVYFPVLIKSLIAHGANIGENYELFRNLIRDSSLINSNQIKARTVAFTGYGEVDAQRVLFCTAHRVTLIGVGEICNTAGENANLFKFPLPVSISSQVMQKSLTTTLAWFSPCNVWSNKYRQAHLYLSNISNNEDLGVDQGMYDFRKSSKGTLQHQIFSGNRADVFIEGGFLTIKVNCRMDASGLENWKKIRYGLAVTLEIPQSVEVDIYEEIKASIQTQVRT